MVRSAPGRLPCASAWSDFCGAPFTLTVVWQECRKAGSADGLGKRQPFPELGGALTISKTRLRDWGAFLMGRWNSLLVGFASALRRNSTPLKLQSGRRI